MTLKGITVVVSERIGPVNIRLIPDGDCLDEAVVVYDLSFGIASWYAKCLRDRLEGLWRSDLARSILPDEPLSGDLAFQHLRYSNATVRIQNGNCCSIV